MTENFDSQLAVALDALSSIATRVMELEEMCSTIFASFANTQLARLRPATCDDVPPGTTVTLGGLKTDALNGLTGTIGDKEPNGRYAVQLPGTGSKSIKLANIFVTPGPPPSGLASTTCSSAESGPPFYVQQPSAAPPAVYPPGFWSD
eukprot:13375142-Heterocapsa_arctica.AAC.1